MSRIKRLCAPEMSKVMAVITGALKVVSPLWSTSCVPGMDRHVINALGARDLILWIAGYNTICERAYLQVH